MSVVHIKVIMSLPITHHPSTSSTASVRAGASYHMMERQALSVVTNYERVIECVLERSRLFYNSFSVDLGGLEWVFNRFD